MPALEPFCTLLGIRPDKLTAMEFAFLEAELFIRICNELKEILRQKNQDYFNLMNYSIKKENRTLDLTFIRFLIQDILLSGDYDIGGISRYIDSPKDVIMEILSGYHYNPSFLFARNLIGLHRTVRPQIYKEIIKKIWEDSKKMNAA